MDRQAGLSLLFHAVSDESRRRIIDLLREGQRLRVGDIAAAFSMSLNGVSKHLKVLEKAGLIRRQIEGRVHYIEMNPGGLDAGMEWFRFQENFWNQRLDRLNQYLNKKEKEKK